MATKRMTWMAAVLGTVALSGMVSCNGKGKDAGAAAISVGGQALTLGDVKSVTVTVSGGITTPLTVPLVGGGAQYSALISDLPVGTNYIFTASAKDSNSVELYAGNATGVIIAKNQTATVIIDMNQVAPGVALSNEAPVIDSLTASALLVSQNDTVTIKATAHDPDAGQTAHLTAVWTTTCAGSLGTQADTTGSDTTDGSSTVVFTAPAADGPCNVTITVKDASNPASVLSTVASLTINVSAAAATGNAKVIANLDTYPVISGINATPIPLVKGSASTLTVTASDSDGDSLNYKWVVGPNAVGGGVCVGTFGTDNKATTTFTLDPNSPQTECTFNVTVDDGLYPDGKVKGGVITNHLSLPVSGAGNTVVGAPICGYDYQTSTTITSGQVVGFAWACTGGCAGGTISYSTVPALGAATPASLGLDPTVFTAAGTYTGAAGAENGPTITITATATCSSSGLSTNHAFTLVPLNGVCNGQPDGTNCTATASATDKCVQAASCLAGSCHVTSSVTCSQNGVDQCKVSACVSNPNDPQAGQCVVGNKPDNTGCNDGLACTGASAPGDLCTSGVCGGAAKSCDQTGVDQCKVSACVEPSGSCVVGNKPDTTVCNDHNGCTGASNGTVDSCTAGVCGGAAVVCSPSNYVCTSLTDTTHVCGAAVCMSPSWDRSTNTTAPVVGLSVSPVDGNPWVAGTLFATFNLNLGSGLVSSSGGADIYLAQLDATGTATQTLTFGDPGSNDQIPAGLAVSKSGTVGVIGVFTSEIDFTAAGSVSGNAGSDYLTSAIAGTGFFVSMLSPPVARSVVMGNGALAAIASNPALDGFAICGQADAVVAQSTTRAGLLTTTSSWVTGNGMDVVVAKINANGTVAWGKQIGGVGDQVCQSVAMDSNGDVLIAGNYGNGTPASFFTTASPAPAAGAAYIYVAKLAGATGNVIAAQGWGTSGRSSVNAVTAIDTSNILIAGSISARSPSTAASTCPTLV